LNSYAEHGLSLCSGDFKHNKQSKPKPNAGGSLINPRIKKRKAATGVVFGDD